MAAAPLERAPGQEVVIRPPKRFDGLHLRELAEYRELLYFLTKRELQVRYKQSVLGLAWAILQPIALTAVFALFFGHLAKVPSDGVPYPVFALAGLVPWIFLSQATAQAATSLIGDANLVSKVYFPRLLIPVSKILSLSIDAGIALVVLVAATVLSGLSLEPRALLAPLLLVATSLIAAGVGILLSALNVKYRDVSVLVPLGIQVWLFATPVVYPGSLVTGAWSYVFALNPAVSLIGLMRWSLVGAPAPPIGATIVSAAVVAAILGGAMLYFRRTERFFADLI